MRCVLTPARIECLPWFQEICSPNKKVFWILLVAEKKLPPALHDPQADPGTPSSPTTGTRESSRLLAAIGERGQGTPLLIAGRILSGVTPSPSQDWTVTPSVTLRYNRWKEPHTSLTKLLVITEVSLTTADCEP